MFDFGLNTQVSDSGPHGSLVGLVSLEETLSYNQRNKAVILLAHLSTSAHGELL